MDILGAWLTVIARDGWANARIGAVAIVAAVDAGAVADIIPDRWAALRSYGRHLDRAAIAAAAADPDASVRDRLFTMIMERFDAAQPHRGAALELRRAVTRDPGLSAFFATDLPCSVARVADAAGVYTTGLLGPLRVKVLTVLYLRVARVWLQDETADLAATMKALDALLAQAERWARQTPHCPVATATAMPQSADGPLPE